MVKWLFDLCLKMESMLEVAEEANRHGWQTKSHTGKKRPAHHFNKLYRYSLCTTKQKQGRETCDTPPLPAQEIEDHVVETVWRIGKDPELVRQAFTETVEQRRRQQT